MLRIAIQNKGRLNEQSVALLREIGIDVDEAKRKFLSKASNFPIEVLYLRDDDIPQVVANGTASLGIVGLNEVAERGFDVEIAARLGFGGCRISLAVPKGEVYNGVEYFRGKRIATSYPAILSRFLAERGVEAELEVITGSVEIAPAAGIADAIFDIVSSGGTLVSNGLKEVVDDVCDMDPAEIRKRYPSVGNRKLDGIQADLRKSRKLIFENNKMSTLRKNTQDLLVEIMAKDMAVRLSGEVDEPVTADIKRLIRLPGSIHGKSGMRVMPLTRSQLTDFDPLSMAVPEEYSDEEVTVSVKRPYELGIRGQHFKLDAGVQKVPEYAAVFLVGRKVADIGDGTVKDTFF